MGYSNALRAAAQQLASFGTTGGGCDYCGMALMNNCVIRDANGKHFVVGCDCVRLSGDGELITAAEKAERDHQKELRRQRQAREREAQQKRFDAELDEQRTRNGGLTDYEVRQRREQDAYALTTSANKAANEWLTSILEPLAGREGFISNMYMKLVSGQCRVHELSSRCLDILAEIYGKAQSGKSLRAKETQAAIDEFNDKVREGRN